MGWLGAENVPVILWSLSMRFNAPDLVLLECVPQFDVQWIEALTDGRLKFHVCVIGPQDTGLPCSGERL